MLRIPSIAESGVKPPVQVTSERLGAGSMPCSLRIRHTVEAPMRWPSRLSSAVMRR